MIEKKKSSPTSRMTSVLMTEEQREIPHGEVIDRIRSYIGSIDVDALIAGAVREAMERFVQTGCWIPCSFGMDLSNDQVEELQKLPVKAPELRRSIRIPVDLHEQVRDAANKLGMTQGSLIRSAVAGARLVARPVKKNKSFSPVVDSGRAAGRLEMLNLAGANSYTSS